MEQQQSQAWLHIAEEVDHLLAYPGARDRFVQQVEGATEEWKKRRAAKREREEKRSKHVKQGGVPHGSQQLPADPRDGSFHWLEDFDDETPPMEAWLPASLEPAEDPDENLTLAVPKREVSLAERYAILAAVYDAYWRGSGLLAPFIEEKSSLAGSYHFHLVRASESNSNCHGPNVGDAKVIHTWIADVKQDLDDCHRRGKQIWTQREVDDAVRLQIKDYIEVIRAARNGNQHKATPKLMKELGARAIARRLGCDHKQVCNSPAWRQLGDEFGMTKPQSDRACMPTPSKIGMDKAEEEAAVEAGDTTEAGAMPEEIDELFDKAFVAAGKVGDSEKKTQTQEALRSLKSKYENGEIDASRVYETLEPIIEQCQDDNSPRVY